jgi:hypothetical protein
LFIYTDTDGMASFVFSLITLPFSIDCENKGRKQNSNKEEINISLATTNICLSIVIFFQ